jgi:hypothetical protein
MLNGGRNRRFRPDSIRFDEPSETVEQLEQLRVFHH